MPGPYDVIEASASRMHTLGMWYLAQVKSNADSIAERNLERQGFVTFRPLERRTKVRGGKFATVLRPFFPGYLFISHAERPAPLAKVNSTYGVARLVSFGGKPALVPDAIIAELQAACDAEMVISVEHLLSPGAKIEITSGTFTRFIGEVERLVPGRRALVLIDFLSRGVRAAVSLSDIRPLIRKPEA